MATAVAVLALLVAACAEDEPEEFTADTETGFLAACTEPLEDSRLISAVCACVFDETQAQLSFQRFRAIDDELIARADGEGDGSDGADADELPDDLAEIIAACIITEYEL